MKGIVLAVMSLCILAVSSAGAGTDTEFGVTNNSATRGADPALMLRSTPNQTARAAQLVSDNRLEVRGARPTVAYTIFRMNSKIGDVALQPVLGRINGAQLRLDF
jgi:hypothetical protein